MEPTITDWIIAISSIITALSVVFVAIQTLLAKHSLVNAAESIEVAKASFQADHDCSRRERALEILRHWTESISITQPSARNLVESFTIEQCNSLIAHKPFSINISHSKTLEAALNGYKDCDKPKIENDSIYLDETHLFNLGYQCMSFLNSLEIAIQGWLHHIGDEDILEQELSYLVKPEKNYHVLKNFRLALGGTSAYPAIHVFVEHVEAKKTAKPDRKSKVA